MNRTAKLLIIEVVVLSVITMLVSPGFLIRKPAVVQPPEVAVMRIDLNDVTLTEIFDNGKNVFSVFVLIRIFVSYFKCEKSS